MVGCNYFFFKKKSNHQHGVICGTGQPLTFVGKKKTVEVAAVKFDCRMVSALTLRAPNGANKV